ncbi:MAG: helix-turn-helix domain-containing protein [Paracoccaceae bacterium]
MQTAHLRTLLPIKNTGSFTAAAFRVNLSHSAVSIQMK